jgi:hypothetical protein
MVVAGSRSVDDMVATHWKGVSLRELMIAWDVRNGWLVGSEMVQREAWEGVMRVMIGNREWEIVLEMRRKVSVKGVNLGQM